MRYLTQHIVRLVDTKNHKTSNVGTLKLPRQQLGGTCVRAFLSISCIHSMRIVSDIGEDQRYHVRDRLPDRFRFLFILFFDLLLPDDKILYF